VSKTLRVGYTRGMARAKSKPSRSADALSTYQAKRDFARTPEPKGGAAASSDGLRFVVQRHRARALHYDVRFEIDGVLASWAVPRGPSLDPGVRRLAVHVEDHPIEYVDFEGVIPHGEYGGGDVIVWDRGRWEPYGTEDPAAAVAAGELHADVWGEKLTGRFVLVRTGPARSGKEQWLMFHKRDEHAQAGWDAEDFPRSVKSGRTNDEVAAEPDAEWRSDLPVEAAEKRLRWAAPSAEELRALDALGATGSWDLDGRRVRLTGLAEELLPGRGRRRPITTRDLVRYYATVAPVLLPYLHERPLNTSGLRARAPEWASTWRDEKGRSHVVADQPATLAWLADHGVVELQHWLAPAETPDRPTYATVAIEHGEDASFDDVLVLGRLFRSAFEHLGITGRAMVTGVGGLDIWVPVAPGPSFAETRAWIEKLSAAVTGTVPELAETVRLGASQNAIGQAVVAPYSVRAAPGAPVAMPLEWAELDDPDLRPDTWTIREAPDRIAAGDPFHALLTTRQRLPRL
jgi:bifunctional non-homologous end joining protein LigD